METLNRKTLESRIPCRLGRKLQNDHDPFSDVGFIAEIQFTCRQRDN